MDSSTDIHLGHDLTPTTHTGPIPDRKSTRMNSSHLA